ncbi:MAG: hypothetical protein Q9208_002724 [Pyrenodesmia sp. 3 TL-2023]
MPGAYVTQISDGQVQAHLPLASTPGPPTTSISFPGHTNPRTAYSVSSAAKVPDSLTETAPSMGANLVNAATTETTDLSAVSERSQPTQPDEAETMPASHVPDIADNATKSPVPIAESSSRAPEVGQIPSPSVEQGPAAPVHGASDKGSSTDTGSVARTPSHTDPASVTSMTSAQSGPASGNLATEGSQSSETLDPSDSDPHSSPSSSIPIAIGTSSQTQTEPLSNTAPHSPLLTNIGSFTLASGRVIGAGDIGSDPAAPATQPPERTSSSDLLGHADPEAQSTLPVVSSMQMSASATEVRDPPPPTEKPQVESPPKLTAPELSTTPPPSDGLTPIGPQLSITTLGTESVSAGFLSTVADASAPASPSATSVPSGEGTPNPVLPEAPAPSQNAAILPQPTLESSSKPSGAIVDIPTATWTTTPPDLKEVVVTNTAWTRDTLITTTSPGNDEPTVVPVFANCEECGPGGSLIVFGVSTLLISYHLPKIPGFPPIPRFHLPCVLFCPSPNGPPPDSSSSQDDHTPPQPGPPRREEENAGDDEDNGEDNQGDKNDDKDDDKKDDKDDDQDNDQDDDKKDDKNDDKDDNQDNQDDDKDNQNDDQDDDQDHNQDNEQDDQEDEDDEQQSTTSQSSSVTGTSSSVSASSETSSAAETESAVVTETAYINERPTGDLAPGADADVNQYLLAAYTSLEIAGGQFDSALLPTATAPSAMPITSFGDLITAGSFEPSSTNAASITLSCARLVDAKDLAMEKSNFLGPTSIEPYGSLQRVGYIAEACGPLADDTAPLSGAPFADHHSFSAVKPTQSQSLHARFVVTNNASACDKTEPTVGDCKKWFGSILSTCGDDVGVADGSVTDAECTIYDLSIEGAD